MASMMEMPTTLTPARLSTCQARRICLVKPSSLGDVVQAMPVLAAVRARFPRAHIAWVVNRAYAPLLRPISLLDDVIEFPREELRRDGWSGWRRLSAFGRMMRAQRFDLAVDLQGLLRSALITWMTGAKTRVGLTSAREGAGFFYTHLLDDGRGDGNAVDRYWRLADALGVGSLRKTYPIQLSAEERAWAREQVAGLPRPLLAVNAGARWLTKRWPAAKFAESANRSLASGGSAILLGGPGEEEVAAAVAADLRVPSRDFCGKTSLRHLAALLAESTLLLTNDTGPLHLAAAVDCPTVSIFTCTSPERAAPVGPTHRVVQTRVSCRSSYLKECSHLSCLADVTVADVAPAVRTALSPPAGLNAIHRAA